jgi:hypothetical protein
VHDTSSTFTVFYPEKRNVVVLVFGAHSSTIFLCATVGIVSVFFIRQHSFAQHVGEVENYIGILLVNSFRLPFQLV